MNWGTGATTARAIAVAAALGAVAGAGGAARAETLADALVMAYKSEPRLASSRAGVRSADEAVVQQRAQGLPQVDGVANYGVTSTADGLGDRTNGDTLSLGVQGSVPLYTGGRIENAVDSAKEAVSASKARLTAVEQTVLLEAVTAYMNVLRDRRFVELARNNVRVISEQLRAAQDRFEVGEVTRTDVSQAEAALAAARANLSNSVGALEASRQAYVSVVGAPPGDLVTPPPLPDLPDNEAAAQAIANEDQPSLVAARFDARAAEYGVKRAIGGFLPTVSLNGDVTYANDIFTDRRTSLGERNSATVSVRASVPILSGGANASAVRQAQAVLSQRNADIQDVARQIRRQVAVSWSNLRVAETTIAANREQIQASQLAYEGVVEEAKLGARTTLDVLNAEQDLLDARTNLVAAERDRVVAAYTLLAAIGKLTVRHLGLNVDAYDPDAYAAQVAASPDEYQRDQSTVWTSTWRP